MVKKHWKNLRSIFLAAFIPSAIIFGGYGLLIRWNIFFVVIECLVGSTVLSAFMALIGIRFATAQREKRWLSVSQFVVLPLAAMVITLGLDLPASYLPTGYWEQITPPEEIDHFLQSGKACMNWSEYYNNPQFSIVAKSGQFYTYSCSNSYDCKWVQGKFQNTQISDQTKTYPCKDSGIISKIFTPLAPGKIIEKYQIYVWVGEGDISVTYIRLNNGKLFAWPSSWNGLSFFVTGFIFLLCGFITGLRTSIVVLRMRPQAEKKELEEEQVSSSSN